MLDLPPAKFEMIYGAKLHHVVDVQLNRKSDRVSQLSLTSAVRIIVFSEQADLECY